MENLVEPHIQVLSRIIQVGAPAYPVGVSIEVELEVDALAEFSNAKGKVKQKLTKTMRKIRINLTDKELEKLWEEWTGKVVDYEVWRESIIQKVEV